MSAARFDVLLGTARESASGAARQRIAEQAGRQGSEGTGSVHGRNSAHDADRFVRHQRHGTCDRFAAAPFAWCVLRARQGQDAQLGQAPVLGTYHSLPRLVARLRIRSEGRAVLPRRPPPQDAGHDPAEGDRPDAGTDPRKLLRVRQFHADAGRRADGIRAGASAW